MTNTFFPPGVEVRFYYDPNPNQNWNNFDTFADGQHIATVLTTEEMLSQIGDISMVINSAPLTFSADFNLPNGKTYNFNRLIPGGMTVHIMAANTPILDPTTPGQ